jgi:hypothetical protein
MYEVIGIVGGSAFMFVSILPILLVIYVLTKL